MKQIIYNCIETPDGTKLHSKYRHDYVSYIDKNGDCYVTDGGNEYLHRSVNEIPAKDLTVYACSPHKEIREVFYWGTYGKNKEYDREPMHEPLYVPLCRLSNPHIEAIIETQKQLPEWRVRIFKEELFYREDNDIFIDEVELYDEN